MTPFSRSALCVAGLLGLLGSPGYARAYEDTTSVGLGVGYAAATSEPAIPEHGLLLSGEVALGLDDIWTLRLLLGAAHHPGNVAFTRVLVSPELLYLVDVFEWVPYFGAGLDGVATISKPDKSLELGAHPVLGIDYLWSREVVIGLALRPVFVLSGTPTVSTYFTAALSVSLLFD